MKIVMFIAWFNCVSISIMTFPGIFIAFHSLVFCCVTNDDFLLLIFFYDKQVLSAADHWTQFYGIFYAFLTHVRLF